MAECPYYKGYECVALDLYREDRFGDRYPYSPCTKDCNQLRIKCLEDKIKKEQKRGMLTGKDLIKLIKDAGAEDFEIYIGIATDPLGVDYCPLDFDSVTIEDNTIKIT